MAASRNSDPRAALNRSTPLATQLTKLDTERRQAYDRRQRFYDGDQWTSVARPKERRVTVNYARAFILKSVAYLLRGREFLVDSTERGNEAADAAAAEAERLLREIHDWNDVGSLDMLTEIDCAKLGDAAFKITWSERDQMPVLSSPHPSTLWWWPDPVRPADLAIVAHQYDLGRLPDELAASLHPAIREASTATRNGTIAEIWYPERMEIWAAGRQFGTQANPWGTPPFVILANDKSGPHALSGDSELDVMAELQRELNREWTQVSQILELSGNPITVLENVTDSADIAVAPGAVWELPEKAKAYLLDLLRDGGAALHLDYLSRTLTSMHDLTEIPRAAWGDNSRTLSGQALRFELDPLANSVQRKRELRQPGYERRCKLLLRSIEIYAPDVLSSRGISLAQVGQPRVAWGEVLEADRTQEVADQVSLVQARIRSRRSAADRLGDPDPEGELARIQQEAEMLGQEVPGGSRGNR